MTAWITICDTCKRGDWPERGMRETDGEAFADLIEAAARGAGVLTRRHSCLMGCDHACNVAIQEKGKLTYTLGGFEGTVEDARGVVDYASLYSESESGQVAYRLWPPAIKGHFVTRHPPLPE